MTFLAFIGAIVLTVVALWPLFTLLNILSMSDYGIIDIKRNFFKEKLWIEFVLIPLFAVLWWFLVGTYITVGFG